MTSEKKETETHTEHRVPVTEERLLHSHHRDKKHKVNPQQTTEVKSAPRKNPERHHKKSIEEEMHLRPLNERHHKFPNPALLEKNNGFEKPSSKVSRHAFLQQVRRKQNRRRPRGGRRLKRNRLENKNQDIISESKKENHQNKKIEKENDLDQEQKKFLKPKVTQNESKQYTQVKNDDFPVKQTSYW